MTRQSVKQILLAFLLGCFLPKSHGQPKELFPDTTYLKDYTSRLNKATDFQSKGIKIKYYNLDTLTQTVSLDIYFFFSKSALTQMTKTIQADSSLKMFNATVSPDSKATIKLYNLTLKWYPDRLSFLSDSVISILSIQGNEIKKTVKGCISLQIKKTSNILDINLQSNDKNWYYFRYTKGLMSAISSNDNYNKIIEKQSERKRKLRSKKEEMSYEYTIGSIQQKNLFVRKIIDVK